MFSPAYWLLLTAHSLALLQQAPPPEVISSVDRDQITVGEEITFTIKVTSQSSENIKIALPPLPGLEVVARSERNEVAVSGSQTRTTTLELRLRALQAGRMRLGPFQVSQGPHVVQGDAAEIVVTGAGRATGVATTINPRVQKLLERAPPPKVTGQVGLTLVLSADNVTVGEQVDVITAAWFPRDLRVQLRRPPTLEAPQIDGVWSYPQPAPVGIAASRLVGGRWYDVFVLHQIVFPLTPGRVRIAPATLHYSVPLAFQFFSQEERYTLSSPEGTLQVSELPDRGRTAAFLGAVGRGLTLGRSVTPLAGRVGEPVAVALTLEGEGNVALWPAPPIRWPQGVRVYSDRTEEVIKAKAGRLAGTKTFRYLVVPDSTGSLLLPSVNYSFFDPATGFYASTELPPTAIPVAPAGEAAVAKALPPPLMYSRRPALPWRLVHGVADWGFWLIVLLPPGAFLLLQAMRRPRSAPAEAPSRDDLSGAQRELESEIATRAPHATGLEGDALIHALRGVGLDPTVAVELTRLRDRVRQARFGPVQGEAVHQIMAEWRALSSKLGAGTESSAPHWPAATTGVVLLLVGALGAGAQTPAAEELYEAGALRSAAEAFGKRTAEEPAVPAHWYNLGAAEYRLGEDGRALAEWSRALRLAPRDRILRRALRLVPGPSAESAKWLRVAPVTPEELLAVGAVIWMVGWAGLIARRGPRGRWVVLVVGAVGFWGAARGLERWYARPVALIVTDSKLQISPHGRAPEIGALGKGSAVIVRGGERGWLLVEDAEKRKGWVPAEVVVALWLGNGEPGTGNGTR